MELKKNMAIPGVGTQFNGPGIHKLSNGKEIEVIEDNMLPRYPSLFDSLFEPDGLDQMDEDELDESGIIWDNYNDDEREMLQELIEADSGRGVANVFNRPLSKD